MDVTALCIGQIIRPRCRDVTALHDQMLLIFDRRPDDLPGDRPQHFGQLRILVDPQVDRLAADQPHLQMILRQTGNLSMFQQPLGKHRLFAVAASCDAIDHPLTFLVPIL